MSTPTRFPLIGYAYELIPGDHHEGREVSEVKDPARPNTGPPFGPGTATVSYSDGNSVTLDRMSEVQFTRHRDDVLGPPEDEAEKS